MPSDSLSQHDFLLSIIIVNYNVRDLLENTLHSIEAASKKIRVEVFVVENASDDGSAEMVAKNFPSVHLIRNEINLGFAKANNQAFKQARGKYFLVLNPDTLLQEDTLQVMLQFLEDNPDVGMSGCKIINADGTIEPNSRRSFPSPWVTFCKLSGLSTLLPKSKLFGKYNLTYLSDDEIYEVDALSGCFMMVRKEVYDKISGFDEDYFMYGEDLDLCYRTQKAGWKIYYVSSTKIIHYGGESTKRSSIDATAVFYDAMKLFVRKNLQLSRFSYLLINIAIKIKLGFSRSKIALSRSLPILLDTMIVIAAIILGELIRFGGILTFPKYAYPTVYIASIVIYIFSLSISGSYTSQHHSVARSFIGVLIGFLIMSSLTFFFKDFAFSRAVVLIASIILFILIPGRRVLPNIFQSNVKSSLVLGRPTLLVGINEHITEIILKLRSVHTATYRLIGIIDVDRKRVGQEINGVTIIGSTQNIGKIIFENKISDVIFLPDVLSYTDIFSIIGRTKGSPVHFRIVARSMEYIVSKAGIDQLTAIPLVDVEYNLVRTSNIFLKRMTDISLSLIGLIAFYPFVYLFSKQRMKHTFSFTRSILLLPKVLKGKMSLVGRIGNNASETGMYLGKPAITGLVHLQDRENLKPDDIINLEVQYARNHSFFLDLEIMFRTLYYFFRKK